MEAVMNMMSAIGYRACDLRVEALRAEFGAILAERIIEAEEVDFLWEARVSERYLGQHIADLWSEGKEELSRMVVLSWLDGRWITALCLVDGEGDCRETLWKQTFQSRSEAEKAFGQAS